MLALPGGWCAIEGSGDILAAVLESLTARVRREAGLELPCDSIRGFTYESAAGDAIYGDGKVTYTAVVPFGIKTCARRATSRYQLPRPYWNVAGCHDLSIAGIAPARSNHHCPINLSNPFRRGARPGESFIAGGNSSLHTVG